MASPILTRSNSTDSALSRHISQVFNYMAGGVGLSALTAWLTTTNPALFAIAAHGGFVWMIIQIAFAFAIPAVIFRTQPLTGLLMFVAYSAFMGFAFAPLVFAYTNTSIAAAFATAAIMFAGTAAYGFYTKRSLSGWGTFLMMGMFGLIGTVLITALLGYFGINMGPLFFVINVVSVGLFSAFTAYEMNMIRDTFAAYGRDELMRSRLSILQAANLYASFIGIFINLLQLMGARR